LSLVLVLPFLLPSNPSKKGGLEKDYPEHMDEGTYGKLDPREKIENPDFETTGNEKSKQRPFVPLLQLHKINTIHSDDDNEDLNVTTNAIRDPTFLGSKAICQQQPIMRTKQQLQFLGRLKIGHKFKTKN
jgi:hypothetical protein